MNVLELAPQNVCAASELTAADIVACRPDRADLIRLTHRLWGKAAFIGSMAVASYFGLVFAADGMTSGVVFSLVLVFAMIATATSVMHDANHGAFGSSRRLNRMVGFSGDILGASSWLWRLKHNVLHHANTNVVGMDTDIEQMPFARLAPGQPHRPWHRYQHIYIWGLYGFLVVQWVFFSDFANLITGRIGSQSITRRPTRKQLGFLFGGKAIHVIWAIAIPLAFHRWWVVAIFYLGCSWLLGFTLAVFFQIAHCVDIVEFDGPSALRRGDDFAIHQLRTTANIEFGRSPIDRTVAWLMGGLHSQIEHHLAPGMPHTSYPAMSARVRQLCTTRGVHYRTHPGMWAALCSHTRWLKTMGRPFPAQL